MMNAASNFLHIFHESFYSFCSLHSVFRPSLHSCVCMEWYGTQKHMVQGKRYVYCFSFHEFFHLTALDLEAFTKNLRPYSHRPTDQSTIPWQPLETSVVPAPKTYQDELFTEQ